MNYLRILCCFLPFCAHAQDHTWWAQNVQWDGVSHWLSYLQFSPKFLGPNALPIPDLPSGRAPLQHSLSLEGQSHFQTGDRTFNPVLSAVYAAVPGKIGFELQFLPIEFFQTSHEVKTIRHVFHTFYHTRHATGDTYLQSYLQLLTHEKDFADLLLRVGYRFPTSNQVGAARFTDTPGYYFDLSTGIPLSTIIRLQAMTGFYVWQTNDPQHAQNDAFLWGAGCTFSPAVWSLNAHVRSYLGYLKNGDDPIVAALRVSRQSGALSWHLQLQHGLHDYAYTSLLIGIKSNW